MIRNHDELADFYTVDWGNALNASTGAIQGIRRQGVILQAGSIVPRKWFDLVPSGTLDYVVNQLKVMTPYEPQPIDELIIYTCYPALKPPIRFANSHHGKTKWYRVTRFVPYGITALRTVEGICDVGDTAFAGDIIPSQWLSALSQDHIQRLMATGLEGDGWFLTLTASQMMMYRRRVRYPMISEMRPLPAMLTALYEQYPATNPNNDTKET